MNPIEQYQLSQGGKKPQHLLETSNANEPSATPLSSSTSLQNVPTNQNSIVEQNSDDEMDLGKDPASQNLIGDKQNNGDTDASGSNTNDLRMKRLAAYKSINNMYNLISKKEFVVPITKIPIEDVESVALEYAFREIQSLGVVSKSDYILIRSIVDSILNNQSSSSSSNLPNISSNPLLLSFLAESTDNSNNNAEVISPTDLIDSIKLKGYIRSKISESLSSKINTSDGINTCLIPDRNETLKIESYSACSQGNGNRKTMEDEHIVITDLNLLMGLNGINHNYSFFGVYDGHVRKTASEYCRARLHVNMVRDENFLSGDNESIKKSIHNAYVNTSKSFNMMAKKENAVSCGTTAVTVIVREDVIFVANAGDSEAVMCTKDGKATLLSYTHVPQKEEERDRIFKAGGTVVYYGNWRVNGILSVSRSIGDHSFENYVIPDPFINQIPRSDDQEFIIMATDGLWDVLKYQEACDFVRNFLSENEEQPNVAERKLIKRKEVAKELIEEALRRKSNDNISVLLIFFTD